MPEELTPEQQKLALKRALRDLLESAKDARISFRWVVDALIDLATTGAVLGIKDIDRLGSSDPGSGSQFDNGTWHVYDGATVVGVLWSDSGIERTACHPDYALPFKKVAGPPAQFTNGITFKFADPQPSAFANFAAFVSYACSKISGTSGKELKLLQTVQGTQTTTGSTCP